MDAGPRHRMKEEGSYLCSRHQGDTQAGPVPPDLHPQPLRASLWSWSCWTIHSLCHAGLRLYSPTRSTVWGGSACRQRKERKPKTTSENTCWVAWVCKSMMCPAPLLREASWWTVKHSFPWLLSAMSFHASLGIPCDITRPFQACSLLYRCSL